MQFADLMRLFREGQNEGRKRGYVSQGACDAEGIAAVVRAVRDDATSRANAMFWDGQDFEDFFDEILGAAGDEAGTHGSPELDEDARKLEAMGQDPGMTLEQLLEPAAAPAPAVCEWTPQDEGPAHEIWKTGCGTMYERAKSTGWCNKCKAPIKFTGESK